MDYTPGISTIIWDVVAEHFDDAAFLWEQWERAFLSANQTATDLSRGTEEQLLAHLDALVIAGPPAAERILLPALNGKAEDSGHVFAAAWTLLQTEHADQSSVVLSAFTTGRDTSERGAMARAIELSGRIDMLPRLLCLVSSTEPTLSSFALDIATGWEEPSHELLTRAFQQQTSLPLLQSAFRALTLYPDQVWLNTITRGLGHDDDDVRLAATKAGLVARSSYIWDVCRRGICRASRYRRLYLALLGLRGDPREWDLAAALLRDPAAHPDLAWALGYWGTPMAVEMCLDLMRDRAIAPVAAESFQLITGCTIDGSREQLPSADTEDSLGDDAELPQVAPEGDLPVPVLSALVDWWEDQRNAFMPGSRYVLGKPVAASTLSAALRVCTMWRRPILALELASLDGGVRTDPRTWARRQLSALRE